MSSVATAMNIVAFNAKQLQTLATNVGVNPVTIVANSTDQARPEKKTNLIAAIKAK